MLLAIDPSAADSARALARKIVAALAGREPLELSVRNASSLPPGETAEAREALENELRPRLGTGGASVAVTFSENAEGYLWVAEIRHEGRRDVAMIALPRTAAAPAPAGTPLVLEKKPLWEQDLPILDAAVREDTLIVLDPTGISFYAGGERRQFLPIAATRPWPRDLRGMLEIQGDTVRAILPGLVCGSDGCKEQVTPLAAGRNFFEPGQFYSSAAAGPSRVVAGVDGRAQLVPLADARGAETLPSRDRQGAVTVIPGWGSDLAAIESRCGNYVLATRAGDPAEADAVQAFALQDRQPVAVSAAVEFLGPVTALWPAADKTSAVAVARNLKTGRYAAFSLSLACGR